MRAKQIRQIVLAKLIGNYRPVTSTSNEVQRAARAVALIGVKYKVVKMTKVEELAYLHKFAGRCMSIRSRGKITSIKVRNSRFGTEHRLFLYNPGLTLNF